MFTGIITAIGTIRESRRAGDLHAVITCPYDPAQIAIGASIACSGVCLTVVARGGEPGNCWFEVDISDETIARTAQGMWREGRRLNLEQALRLGDELGGHIVTGHVDAVGRIARRERKLVSPTRNTTRSTLSRAWANIRRFISRLVSAPQ